MPRSANGKVASVEEAITKAKEALAADEKRGFYRRDDGAPGHPHASPEAATATAPVQQSGSGARIPH